MTWRCLKIHFILFLQNNLVLQKENNFRCILLNFSTNIDYVLQVIITVFLKGTLPQDIVVSRTSRKRLSIVKRPYIIIQTHSRKAVRCLAWTRSHKILWHRLPISNTSLHVSQYPTPSPLRPTITTSSTLQHEHPQHQPPSSTLVWWNPECGICTVQESVMANWRFFACQNKLGLRPRFIVLFSSVTIAK